MIHHRLIDTIHPPTPTGLPRRFRKALSIALMLMAATLLGSCSQTKKASPTSVQSAAPNLDPQAFRQLWLAGVPVDAGDAVDRLFIESDTLFAYTPKDVVYSLKKTSGVLQYYNYVNGHGGAIRKPVVLSEWLVIPSGSTLEVYNRKTGQIDHSIPLTFTISSNVVGEGNHVYFGGDLSGGRVAMVDVTNIYRPLQWTLIMNGAVDGAPAFNSLVLFVGSGDGGVRAIDADRETAWILDNSKFDMGAAIVGDLKVDDAGVYAGCVSGRFVCLDRNKGKLLWQYFASHALKTGPVVTKSTVYLLVPEEGMVALDKIKQVPIGPHDKHLIDQQNRTARWTAPLGVQLLAEGEKLIYLRTADNSILAVDRATGEVRYEAATPFVAFATNTTDSTIYAATAAGQLYALKPLVREGIAGYQEQPQ